MCCWCFQLFMPWNTESHLCASKLTFTGYRSRSYPGDRLLSQQRFDFMLFSSFLNDFLSFPEDFNILKPHFFIIFVLSDLAMQKSDSPSPFQSLFTVLPLNSHWRFQEHSFLAVTWCRHWTICSLLDLPFASCTIALCTSLQTRSWEFKTVSIIAVWITEPAHFCSLIFHSHIAIWIQSTRRLSQPVDTLFT